jgi:glycosyltransferase involved in cell wall biosynthesis
MLCGVPTVVSDLAGFAEIVRDGVDGRVVQGERAGEWAGAIRDVLSHRANMSAACLARRDELSYSHHLKTLLGLYDRAVTDRRR